MRVLVVSRRGLVVEVGNDLAESGGRARTVLVLAAAKLDGVSESLEAVEAGDVGRLGGVLTCASLSARCAGKKRRKKDAPSSE